MMACHQLSEEKCQAIFKPKDDTHYFTLGSEFILFADDNSTILVKKDFLTSLGKYEWTKLYTFYRNCNFAPFGKRN